MPRALLLALGAATVLVGAGLLLRDHGPRDVVFVVLDNVRADHLSLCGYERPTSPNLEAFAATAWSSCEAVVPGSWTVPSHASFFTGLEVAHHGAHYARGAVVGVSGDKPWQRAFGLRTDVATLAERFAERGYQTALVSANPVLGGNSGLTRGFERARVAPGFGAWYGGKLIPQVEKVLTGFSSGPRFLFVNIADAHIPWHPTPAGLGWARARRAPNIAKEPGTPMNRHVAGNLTPGRQRRLRAHWTDAYDYAVYRADRTFGALVRLLADHGLDEARIVVTSDHGEFLGEHRMVSHCCSTYEPNARVPLLARNAGPQPDVGPLAGRDVYTLVLDGRWPAIGSVPRMVAGPNPSWDERSDWFGKQIWVSEWVGTTKRFWIDGARFEIDLAVDPEETELVATDSEQDGVDDLARSFVASLAREATDEELDEQLEALGYLD